MSRELALALLTVMAVIYTMGAVFQLRPTERDRARWKQQPNRPPDTFDHFMSWLLVIGLWAVIIAGLSACAPTERTPFCELAKPIKWTTYDSRETVNQIIAHNRTGLNTCFDWSDPGGELLYGVEP